MESIQNLFNLIIADEFLLICAVIISSAVLLFIFLLPDLISYLWGKYKLRREVNNFKKILTKKNLRALKYLDEDTNHYYG